MIVPIVLSRNPNVCRANGDLKATTGIEPVERPARPIHNRNPSNAGKTEGFA